MTDMPELIYLYDRGVPRGMQVVYGGTRIVGDTEYTRSDTIQALRESHDRLLDAMVALLNNNYLTDSDKESIMRETIHRALSAPAREGKLVEALNKLLDCEFEKVFRNAADVHRSYPAETKDAILNAREVLAAHDKETK